MGRTLFLADSREMREVEMQWAGGMLLPVLEGEEVGGGGVVFYMVWSKVGRQSWTSQS